MSREVYVLTTIAYSETKKHEIMQTAEVRIASADTLQDTEHMV